MLSILKRFFDFCTEEDRKKFYTSLVLGLLKAMIAAMRIPAIALILNALIINKLSMTVIWQATGILLLSLVLNIFVTLKITMLQTEGGYHTCAQKRIEIAEHIRYLPMGYFNQNSLGKITSITTNTLESLSNIATRVVMVTTQGFLTTAVITLFVLLYDWRIGLILIAGLAVFLLPNGLMRMQAGAITPIKQKADTDLVDVILEYVQGIAEVKSFNITKQSAKRLSQTIFAKRDADIKMTLVTVPWIAVQNIITKLTGVAMCGAAIWFYLQGSMDLLICMMMVISAYMVYESLDGVSSFSSLLRSVDLAVELVQEVFALQPMNTKGQDIQPQTSTLELDQIIFTYEKRPIIENLSLTMPEKTRTAIIGPSGSGKTTLCHLIARFWDLDSGSIRLDGHPLTDYSYDSLIRNFSFVFQNVYLFEDSIENNIKFGRQEASHEEVVAVAKKARCHDFIMNLPNGYETVIGEAGASLSGGEKQRISIARAMMKDAPIIILDEATANIDPENEAELMTAVDELTQDKTIIMIAHRLKTVENADQIVVLDKGQIVQQGKHDQLAQQAGIYRDFITTRKEALSWKLATEN
ncbi:ABC transporter ATP-binding protein [Streptococcus mutans]|uniref:ABC transporter ATP-binding protein n=1 Tax=Streptococcus mutans TaxID=1309 RepID=UPI000311F976|nr:ABC transporter ATP-binding protein [Streptococcus mutans]QIQ93692.1 ABC transporter ATP-binding protein [Streptococcus mutans]QIQ99936.1 ABC transporter ATP-binding protein [Streptococcus mutans]QIR01582.1 ABC transporter ATP-binding protein [Streptococcus mutans]QIR03713.1 ABC transporter ATP-binding protein [Streptococcus mutans]